MKAYPPGGAVARICNVYTYDANSNLLSDYNKGITAISYNYLNLPNVVTIPGKGTITYTYDAAGTKLQKTTVDQTISPNKTTNYYYAGNYLYRNDTVEYVSHAEGRLRPLRIDTTQPISITNLKYIYDYYLKDHLGSVRNVLSTEQETDLYVVTEETAAAAKEDALFANVSSSRFAKPGGFDGNGSNAQVSQLNGDPSAGNYKRVGPSIILKVMAGDTITINAMGWYYPPDGVQPPPSGMSTIISDLLLPLLTNGVVGDGGTKGGAIPSGNLAMPLTNDLTSLINSQTATYVPTQPKAFLNWLVVDEEFAAVSSLNHFGAVQMPAITGSMQAQPLVGPSNMVIRRNGYLYVYLSNESKQNVYFDNLIITHKRGPLVEQKDYYAFGMEIPGLSTQALKYQYNQNRFKYNGIEYDTAFGLDYCDAFYRDLDPQIGRWTTIDPKVEDGQEMWSPYVSNFDNPVRYQDPKGDCPTCLLGALIGGVVDAAVQVAGNMANGQSFSTAVSNINGTQVAIAAAAGFVTSGVSVIYSSAAATGTAIAVSEATTQAAVVGTSSVLSQVNDNISKGQDAMNISPVKMAIDIATDRVATNISKNVATTSVTTAERQLNRAERVASNDPTSSGRASNVQQAQNKVNGINTANTLKQTTVSNAISSTTGAVSTSSNSRSQMGSTAPVPKQDATYVKKPYIRE